MLKVLLLSYLALMPFLHALSPLPIIAANALILACVTPFVLAKRPTHSDGFLTTNFLLAVVWIYGIVAWVWQPYPIMEDRWQATIQWAFSFMFLWIVVRRWIAVSGVSFSSISTVAFFTSIFLGFSIIIEFFTLNALGFYFSDFLPFSTENLPFANIFGSALIRPRAFSAEAGFTSMVLELTIPLSLIYWSRASFFAKMNFIVSCACGAFMLFSLVSIISILCAIFILGSLRKKKIFTKSLLLLGVSIITLTQFFAIGVDDLPFYKIYAFFDPSAYYYAEGSRQETLSAGLALLRQNPLGFGWGLVLQESKIPGSEIDRMIFGSGLINLWLEMAVAIGVILTLVVIGHVCSILVNLLRVKTKEADICFVCVCSLALHHVAVFELWFPMFWFALALAQVLLAKANGGGSDSSTSVNLGMYRGRHVSLTHMHIATPPAYSVRDADPEMRCSLSATHVAVGRSNKPVPQIVRKRPCYPF